jgi:hypothetical protein
MSLSDIRRAIGRPVLRLTAGALCLGLSACQVTPLYADRSTPGYDMAARPAADIIIEAADDRVGQELRNELIFLLHGGAGQPSDARYRVDLTVTRSDVGILRNPCAPNTRSRIRQPGTSWLFAGKRSPRATTVSSRALPMYAPRGMRKIVLRGSWQSASEPISRCS